jgi:hypothetical protein
MTPSSLHSLKVAPLLKLVAVFARNQESSVYTVKGYRLNSWGLISGREKRFSEECRF